MRLIDADELVEKLGEEFRRKGAKQVKDNFMNYIYDAPTVDAKPVVHGRWEFHHMTGEIAHYAGCSNCGEMRFWKSAEEYFNYCPSCGCKMDLQEES